MPSRAPPARDPTSRCRSLSQMRASGTHGTGLAASEAATNARNIGWIPRRVLSEDAVAGLEAVQRPRFEHRFRGAETGLSELTKSASAALAISVGVCSFRSSVLVAIASR